MAKGRFTKKHSNTLQLRARTARSVLSNLKKLAQAKLHGAFGCDSFSPGPHLRPPALEQPYIVLNESQKASGSSCTRPVSCLMPPCGFRVGLQTFGSSVSRRPEDSGSLMVMTPFHCAVMVGENLRFRLWVPNLGPYPVLPCWLGFEESHGPRVCI